MSSIIVSNIKGQVVVDSRIIAKGLGIAHKSMMENIRKYSCQLTELGHLPFETAPDSSTFSLLNEDQAIFALTLSRNTPRVVKCKLDLVVAFKKAREELAKQKTSFESIADEKDWGKLRADGKQYRRTYTDRIKEAGGKNMDYAKATNEIYIGATGLSANQIKEQRGLSKSKRARDALSMGELQIVAMTEWHLSEALPNGSNLGQINQASRSQAERLKSALLVF